MLKLFDPSSQVKSLQGLFCSFVNLPVLRVCACVSRELEITHRHTFTFAQALHTPRRVPHGGGLKGQHTHGELEAHLGGCPGPGTTLLPRRRRTAARGRAYADRTGYAGAGSTRVRPAGEAGDRMRDPRRLRTGRRAGERAETYNHTQAPCTPPRTALAVPYGTR